MARPLKRAKGATKSMVLHSAAKLFCENGYSNTRIADIAKDSQVTYNEIFRMFDDKDTLLSNLIELVMQHQFNHSHEFLKDKTNNKLLTYAFELVLQLHIAESSEHLREMYAVSYSLPNTSLKIYNFITKKIEETFKKYLSNYETKDFYELEIAAAGITRGFIINPCSLYFTMDRKVRKYLETTLKIYEVPKDEIEEAIKFVNQFDMKYLASIVVDSLLEYLVNKT